MVSISHEDACCTHFHGEKVPQQVVPVLRLTSTVFLDTNQKKMATRLSSVNTRNLAKLDNSTLFFELRSIEDVQERRAITFQVHELKMNFYRSKAAYSGSLAQHLVDDVHPMFRRAFAKLLNNSKEGDVKLSQFDQANADLHHHHGAEDEIFFPQWKEKHPHISDELKVLENDHAALVVMESEIKLGSYSALQEFVEALNDHLNREEMLLVPLLLCET